MRFYLTSILSQQENHRSPISIRVLRVYRDGPYEFVDMDDRNDYVVLAK